MPKRGKAPPAPGEPPERCGAKLRNGGACSCWPIRGRARCRMHGGQSLRGPASPAYKHGRYAEFLPDGLRDRYRAALADPALLELRDEISLLDGRLGELLARVERGESGELWRLLGASVDAFAEASARQDGAAMRAILLDQRRIIERGRADEAAWREVRNVIQDRRRLVESERKRLVETQQMLSVEQAMSLVAAVTEAVRSHVTDPHTLSAVAEELGRVLDFEAYRGAHRTA